MATLRAASTGVVRARAVASRGITRCARLSISGRGSAQPTAGALRTRRREATRIIALLADAVATAAAASAPSFDRRFTTRELWQRVFAESYSRELRPENDARVASLYDLQAVRFDVVTRFALEATGFTVEQDDAGGFRLLNAPPASRLSLARGKLLSALRLAKAAFTFDGGPDYLVLEDRAPRRQAPGDHAVAESGTRCSAPRCWRGAGGGWVPSADQPTAVRFCGLSTPKCSPISMKVRMTCSSCVLCAPPRGCSASSGITAGGGLHAGEVDVDAQRRAARATW